MARLLVSGGGDLEGSVPRGFDARIVDAVRADAPTAVLLPTASRDDPAVRESFRAIYGDALGCETSVVRTVETVDDDAGDRIRTADLLYVAGGDTSFMLETWREHGLVAPLREAAAAGCLLTGVSAGAICWFADGFSDSVPGTDYAFIDGLAFVDGVSVCPHAQDDARRERFRSAIETRDDDRIGIALTDFAAVQVDGTEFRFRFPDDVEDDVAAYLVSSTGEVTVVTPEATRDDGVRSLDSV